MSSFKGVIQGILLGSIKKGVIKGDTTSLDYSSRNLLQAAIKRDLRSGAGINATGVQEVADNLTR